MVRYGGYSESSHEFNNGNVWAEGNTVVKVRNSTISQGWNAGIYIGGSGASLTVSDSTIDNNGSSGSEVIKSGIYNGADSVSDISCSNIHGNGSYGVYNANASATLNAGNNWWGSETGPYHPTLNPTGTGDRVSGYVDFSPWASAPY